jgi:uncharacterized membrane protein
VQVLVRPIAGSRGQPSLLVGKRTSAPVSIAISAVGDATDSEMNGPPPATPSGDSVGRELNPRSSNGRARRWTWRPPRDQLALLGLAAGFVLLITYLGELRYEEFFTTNWDLGINQQLLWTTAHGRLLYETGDAEFFGVQSFLEVHPAYIAFLLVPLYAVAPYPVTLFVVQAVMFALSVVPLYLLARSQLPNPSIVVLLLALYLLSFPALSAILYDFHWEAFVPLEYLTFFYLIWTRRFALSAVPLAAGLLTLEVFPFLVGGIALLWLIDRFRVLGGRWRSMARDWDSRFAVLLLAGMAVAYLVLRVVQYDVIPAAIGAASPGNVASGIGQPFLPQVSSLTVGLSLTYWVLLFSALAFLPLLAPRFLVLSIPWFVYSVVLSPSFATQFGDQYAFLALAPLAVAMVFGAGRLEKKVRADDAHPFVLALAIVGVAGLALALAAAFWSPVLLSRSIPWPLYAVVTVPFALLTLIVIVAHRRTATPRRGPESWAQLRRWRTPRVRGALLGGALATFVAFNLLMSPLNTDNFQATPYPGYWLEYSSNPMSSEMGWITNRIPSGAVLLASDYLFPYVANDQNAWAVPWYTVVPGQPPVYFPFSATNLPTYVLTNQADWFNFPSSITSRLSNSSVYGLVAFVFMKPYPGTVSLYELDYHGAPQARYISKPPPVDFFTAQNLSTGPSGRVGLGPSAKFRQIIFSQPVSDPNSITSAIWYGPYVTLPPATYVITANLSGSLAHDGNSSQPILTMNGGPFVVPPLYNISVYANQLSSTSWTNITWTLVLPVAYNLIEFRGYLTYVEGRANGHVELNYIEVAA